MRYFNNPEAMLKLIAAMQDGFSATLTIFFLTLVFSIPLGMVLALLRMSKRRVISMPVALYILVMRGTPLMLQIFAIYFAIPMLLGQNLDRMAATVLAFSLNYAAYFAEIFRGGIDTVARGQWEAGKALGMNRAQVFLKIILPQVMRNVILPVSNEVITLVKDTALVTAVGIVDLYRAAKNATSSSGSLEPLFIAGLVYLLLNTVVTWCFSQLHRRAALP